MHDGSAVYACYLDASKAFDLVSHEILFCRLLDKNFPVQLILLVMSCTKTSACASGGMVLSYTVSPMVSSKGVSSP